MTFENKSLLSLKGLVRKRCPLLLSYAGKFYAKHIGFKEVREYLQGERTSVSERETLLLLSTNRSATQFVESVLAKIYEADGGKYVPLNRYLFFSDPEAEEHVLDANYMRDLMVKKGFFFGQQGPFEELDGFRDLRIVTVVRDPRDLVVSNYHSIASAHVPRDKAYIQKIKKVQELGLEGFARSDEFLQPIEAALQQATRLLEWENVMSWRYEDLMDRFDEFETSCQQFILGRTDEELSKEVRAMNLGAVDDQEEDGSRHRRSGRWGQFRKALDPETILFLNERFAPYLKEFDYGDSDYRRLDEKGVSSC